MQKTFAHAKENHAPPSDSAPRPRSSSNDHHHHHHPHHTKNDSRKKSPPTSYLHGRQGTRPRASTVTSTTKRVISDTDEQAQMTPSIFQYAFGR